MRSVLGKVVVGTTVVALAALGSVGCGGRRDDNSKASGETGAKVDCTVSTDTRISIATGNTTGVYYPLGNALAEQVSAVTGGKLKATAAETGASVQNIQQLVAGTHQVAFSLFDTATDAINGKGAFTAKQPVQALARIYDNYTHVVVQASSGINSVEDMKGKKISTGSPKSGTEVIAERVLKAAGLDPAKDVSQQRLDLTKTVDGMKDGSIDGFFFSGGLPTPGVTDLFTTAADKVKFIDITPLLPKMSADNAAYQKGTIPAASYKQTKDVPTIVVANVLLAKDDFAPSLGCVITKTLLDKKDELIKVNAAAKGIALETVRKTEPIALNTGSAKALTDAGAK